MNSRWLIAAVPVTLALAWREAPPLAVFVAALVSIVPLVGLIGTATERLAARLGPTLGGLVNSTLNNLPELIIGGVALANRNDYRRTGGEVIADPLHVVAIALHL